MVKFNNKILAYKFVEGYIVGYDECKKGIAPKYQNEGIIKHHEVMAIKRLEKQAKQVEEGM